MSAQQYAPTNRDRKTMPKLARQRFVQTKLSTQAQKVAFGDKTNYHSVPSTAQGERSWQTLTTKENVTADAPPMTA